MDLTSVTNYFISGGNIFIACLIIIINLIIVPVVKYWINRENSLQRTLASSRKKERDAQFERVNIILDNHEGRIKKSENCFDIIKEELNNIKIDTAKISTAIEFIVPLIKDRYKT